jgi:hypothetical protein
MRIQLLMLLALLSGAVAVDTEPPVISIDLSAPGLIKYDSSSGMVGANNFCKNDPTSALCRPAKGTESGNGYAETYMKQCNVLVDDASTCPEPTASAYDHHDAASTTVHLDVELYIRSDPHAMPSKVRDNVNAVDYHQRGEFLLSYNAADRAGNKAEEARFAMVMIGECPVLSSESSIVD